MDGIITCPNCGKEIDVALDNNGNYTDVAFRLTRGIVTTEGYCDSCGAEWEATFEFDYEVNDVYGITFTGGEEQEQEEEEE